MNVKQQEKSFPAALDRLILLLFHQMDLFLLTIDTIPEGNTMSEYQVIIMSTVLRTLYILPSPKVHHDEQHRCLPSDARAYLNMCNRILLTSFRLADQALNLFQDYSMPFGLATVGYQGTQQYKYCE